MPTASKGTAVRHDLMKRVNDARSRSDTLFHIVRPGSLYERPIPERHRIIFYIGHLEAFDWNLLGDRVFGLRSVQPDFDRLFAFGIDPVNGGLPSDQPSEWPGAENVYAYVASIRRALEQRFAHAADCDSPGCDGFPLETLLNVCIEHRLMHVETLAYMLHQLPLDGKLRLAEPTSPDTAPVDHEMMEIPAGEATLGLSRETENFGWDNEFRLHTAEVPAFAVDRFKITNRQYLDFLNVGGYETRAFWSAEDWNWKAARGISHPIFWKQAGGRWLYRTMFDEVPLPLNWPVYVSQAEASAYARWVGKSLPTEAEWQRAAYGTPAGAERAYPWGSAPPASKFGNFDLARWDPAPVDGFPAGRSAFGVDDLVGNGWEWTSTIFAPFPGFEPFPFYRGYSADFFDGKHFVMKGGSARTAACMLRPTFRNWFQAHYQYVYAGFRCVSH
jgi:gamma-glutamyl hercynylcysteine S-oxide synthase